VYNTPAGARRAATQLRKRFNYVNTWKDTAGWGVHFAHTKLQKPAPGFKPCSNLSCRTCNAK